MFSIQGQYVNIPDVNFANWLKTKYPGCMSGNMLDTTCAAVRNALSISVRSKNISDLDGIQYFKSLTVLDCYENNISQLTNLPANLKDLNCEENNIQYIDALPPKLEFLTCYNNDLYTLPTLPAGLKELNLALNQITSLPPLPNGLKKLNLMLALLDSLPELSDSLEELTYYLGTIKRIPTLPSKLKMLNVSENSITSMPTLPPSLEYLICNNNKIENIPNLPTSLKILICNNNQLDEIPEFPSGLKVLNCGSNNIRCLPPIPVKLKDTTDVLLARSYWFEMKGISIEGNPFTCLPNYVQAMDTNLLKFPVCALDDTTSNPNGCNPAEGIKGILFQDNNANCKYDLGERLLKDIPVNLRDVNRNLLARQMTLENGNYYFLCTKGIYYIDIDTTGLPVEIKCLTGIEKKISTNNFIPNVKDINFGLSCKNRRDLAVKSILAEGVVFPGRKHTLRIAAGDMGQWFGLNCSTGIGGQVKVTVSGKIKYLNPAPGAKTPTVFNDSSFTYIVADFGNVNMKRDFGLIFSVDTFAGIGDSVKVDVFIVSDTTELNTKNNHKKHAYRVVNSFDPNYKEVYPTEIQENSNGWLTYTIHFQNTGSAPAFDIKLTDTLDKKLNLETFQVLNYSHPMRTELRGNVASFIFNDIMLPDSHTNYDGSCGFVQYRLRPTSKYPKGTKIYNTAYIYFDYNSPVITNTSINEYVKSVNSNIYAVTHNSNLVVYPNPSDGHISILTEYSFMLSVKDLQGREILKFKDIKELSLPQGAYFLEFFINGDRFVEKLVIY